MLKQYQRRISGMEEKLQNYEKDKQELQVNTLFSSLQKQRILHAPQKCSQLLNTNIIAMHRR